MSSKKSSLYKCLTAGDGGVGKTTLLHRYIHDEFLANTQMTLGVEFFIKEIAMENINVMLQLWDFGGQDHFRFMLRRYALGAKGAIIMFDLTRIQTLEHIDEWVDIVRSGDPDLPIIFVGSKLDLEDDIVVQDDYALDIKETFDFVDFIKVSSKTGENVESIFKLLAKLVVERP